MEIKLTQLNTSDKITIRTRFSAYSFQVTDPLKCRGFLSGGLLGDKQQEAFFAGAISSAYNEPCGSTRLKTGYPAIFFVGAKYLRRLTTSIVTEINLSVALPEVC